MNLTDDVESEVSDSGELAFRLTVIPDEPYHHRAISGRNGSSWCRQHSVFLGETLAYSLVSSTVETEERCQSLQENILLMARAGLPDERVLFGLKLFTPCSFGFLWLLGIEAPDHMWDEDFRNKVDTSQAPQDKRR